MSDKRKPVCLIAGGRGSARRRGADPLIGHALRCAGVEKPGVAYIGAASGDNTEFFAFIRRILARSGAGDVILAPLCGKRADPAKAARVMESAPIIFMSGGDVDEGMETIKRTGMAKLLRELYRNGKHFFGVSAGSIMLARKWIRWRDPEDDAGAELFPCLSLAPVFCDTHDEKDGWEELRALQALAPAGSISYGIPSGAGLIVEPDGVVRALGGEVHRFGRRKNVVVQLDSLLP